MSRNSARSIFLAILTLVTVGTMLSSGAARAQQDVTEDQILRAL